MEAEDYFVGILTESIQEGKSFRRAMIDVLEEDGMVKEGQDYLEVLIGASEILLKIAMCLDTPALTGGFPDMSLREVMEQVCPEALGSMAYCGCENEED